jgi:putative transposase
MKQSRFTEERIIAILREHEAGSKTADICGKRGISGATFYKWNAKYGGLDVSEVRRLKILNRREREAEEAIGRCSTTPC